MEPTTTTVLSSANELLGVHSALISQVRTAQQKYRRQLHSLSSPTRDLLQLPLISTPSASPSPPPEDSPSPSSPTKPEWSQRADLPPVKRARVARYRNYVPEEETIRNDYSQRYVDGGEWPQNWVQGAELEHRFEEYPKQQRLLNLKRASVNEHSLPPTYLPHSELSSLHPSKFDIILLDPPFTSSFTWDHLQELPVPNLAADPSFVFLWVGSGAGEGLERGREVLAKWGYRRCEDVVWVKTNNASNNGPGTDPPTTSLLTRTKQHCLMGIRGTVRRSTDSWFVHCNVDTDVIIWEGDPSDPTRKPPEMYTLIENFCLGLRRLEIFGRPTSLRRGWVTALAPSQHEHLPVRDDGSMEVGGEDGGRAIRWQQKTWEEGIKQLSNGGKPVLPMTQDIDHLRPKSPVRHGQSSQASGAASPAVGMGNNRFNSGNRAVFNNNLGPSGNQVQMMAPNPMMPQSMMGMGVGVVGMGNGGVMDEMMGAWNPMMGGMNVGGMGGMANNGMGMNMMSQMGVNNAFQGQGGGYNSAVPVYNAGINGPGMGWGGQSQFGIEGGWDGNGMVGMGIPGMNMGGMNINGMGIPSQWGSSSGGNFDSFH